jgi:hypothetical protein
MDKTLATLADFAASRQFDHVPRSVLHETKRHLLDFLGCALGAFTAESVTATRRLATGVLGGELGGLDIHRGIDYSTDQSCPGTQSGSPALMQRVFRVKTECGAWIFMRCLTRYARSLNAGGV